ncbi:KATNB1-like protein 1 isoform X2 [Gadus macrocephalus]|uniref:KATNB1-like protein 1 isoform X2 n=1 Tax=Gadus macrocephalus TaxID=80720 RepID=UPI0028CBA8EE|nr:KATNB1-like protein 1 isoform X2 [Gadus macrocephalus]
MDSKLGDEHYMGEGLPQDEVHYSEENPMQVVYAKRDDFTRKRFPATRPGTSSTGRAKRVVSCKRKTHHLVVVRRKPATAGRPCGTGNKENERARTEEARTEDPRTCMDDDDTDQEMFHVDPWEFPLNLTRDHNSMVNVLFGRNLRLKVALTLWQRNVGELLTYFLRMEDTGVIVDFLPIITQSIHEDSSGFTIGCCVDLFPFVKKVLSSPYEEYVAVGLKWIQSVLKKWFEQLLASGLTGRTNNHLDKNFQVFNQQLVNLWHHDPGSSLVLKMPPTLAKVIDSYLSQLT